MSRVIPSTAGSRGPTVDQSQLAHVWDSFGVLTGPLTEPSGSGYRVRFQRLRSGRPGRRPVFSTAAVVCANVAVELGFVLWLLAPSHHPTFDGSWALNAANAFVLVAVALVEGLRLVNVVSLSVASLLARDPVPVRPDAGLRVAFLTTIVPGKEPVEMVRRTLQAARRIRFEGRLDVWLLDEGDSDEVRAMCAEEGVHHFSRRGQGGYNREAGLLRARTKHGNYNAWLDTQGHRYDVFCSVDPDHLPSPDYADRMLGYFRDPDVAFVVAPQSYANDGALVTRAAESQQFPFHALVQRAGNAYGAPMLVGTNNAVRVYALACVGGLSDSITEDLATGLAMHTRRNLRTGRRWRSVYTPDVVAVGEGPATWGDYFNQQLRWSRGSFELLRGRLWTSLPKLGGLAPLHYLLMMAFYPSMALGWVLGLVNAGLYLVLGASGMIIPPAVWLALYVDATVFQLWVYVRNRRHNVSPFEPAGTSGVAGMAMSVMASPTYAVALLASLLRLPARFVVTAKTGAARSDTWRAFRHHLVWAGLLAAAITVAVVQGRADLDVLMWPVVALLVALAPPVLAWVDATETTQAEGTRPSRTPAPVPVWDDWVAGPPVAVARLPRQRRRRRSRAGTPSGVPVRDDGTAVPLLPGRTARVVDTLEEQAA